MKSGIFDVVPLLCHTEKAWPGIQKTYIIVNKIKPFMTPPPLINVILYQIFREIKTDKSRLSHSQ